MSDPAPTEVSPTMKPPTMPMNTVGSRRTGTWSVPLGVDSTNTERKRIESAPMIRAEPSKIWSSCSAAFVSPRRCITYVPANAAGTEPMQRNLTTSELTVLRLQWIATPAGFMNSAAIRSEAIAAEGVTPKSSTSIGVIKAPPPIPVSPIKSPTTALPRTR
jgi:hypothetical protein